MADLIGILLSLVFFWIVGYALGVVSGLIHSCGDKTYRRINFMTGCHETVCSCGKILDSTPIPNFKEKLNAIIHGRSFGEDNG